MSNFKAGDIVRCVYTGGYLYITEGRDYSVVRVDDNHIYIENDCGASYYESHLFKLVKSNQKPADRPKYVLVEAKKDEFLKQVNELIAQGYKPQGGVSVDQQFYIQAMVLGD